MESLKMESKTYQYRKVTKPLLERKRRARINKCLDELKDLMVECMRQQGDNVARLEKADILELTVDHLKNMKKNRLSTNSNNNNIDSFRSGYVHAANEVSRTLATLPRVDINLGRNLMTHLGHRLNQIQQQQQQQPKLSNEQFCEKEMTAIQQSIPLNVICSSNNNNNNNCSYSYGDQHHSVIRKTMFSPAASSGYGSDNEFSSAPSSPNGLLQIAATVVVDERKNVWRPW